MAQVSGLAYGQPGQVSDLGTPPGVMLPSTPPRTGAPLRASHAASGPGATFALGPSQESVRSSREFVRATLRDWALEQVLDTAELVVSELATNALRHGLRGATPPGHRPVCVGLFGQSPFVLCTVADPADAPPILRPQNLAAETGRGLSVVDACAVRWGWHPLDGGGKVVWALLR
jgi:hypothetical protein